MAADLKFGRIDGSVVMCWTSQCTILDLVGRLRETVYTCQNMFLDHFSSVFTYMVAQDIPCEFYFLQIDIELLSTDF